MGTYKFLESNFKSTYCLLIFGFHCVTACQTDVSRTRLERLELYLAVWLYRIPSFLRCTLDYFNSNFFFSKAILFLKMLSSSRWLPIKLLSSNLPNTLSISISFS